jgi:type IV secretory pathway TraG/TraD family ATPase VirD4
VQLTGRPLLTPDEVMRLGPRPIVLVQGERPYLLERLNYLADLDYAGRAAPNPYHASAILPVPTAPGSWGGWSSRAAVWPARGARKRANRQKPGRAMDRAQDVEKPPQVDRVEGSLEVRIIKAPP